MVYRIFVEKKDGFANEAESLLKELNELLEMKEVTALRVVNRYDVEDIDEEYIKQAKMLVISGTSLCTSPSREAALKAMFLAKKNGTVVVFDIDYRSYTWKNKDEISIYYNLVAQNADMILGSREEFDLTEAIMGGGNDDLASAKLWHSYGAKLIIIKHGKEGSYAYAADGTNYKVNIFPVKMLKGFGGGDGYASAFLYSILNGKSLKDALEFGVAASALKHTIPGDFSTQLFRSNAQG